MTDVHSVLIFWSLMVCSALCHEPLVLRVLKQGADQPVTFVHAYLTHTHISGGQLCSEPDDELHVSEEEASGRDRVQGADVQRGGGQVQK